MAGRGHFYFIDDNRQIEKKVLDALQRERFEYIVMKSFKLFTGDGEYIEDKKEEGVDDSIAHGTTLTYLRLCPLSEKRVHAIEVTLYDPNSDTEKIHVVQLKHFASNEGGEAIFKIAANDVLRSLRGEQKEKFSIKY